MMTDQTVTPRMPYSVCSSRAVWPSRTVWPSLSIFHGLIVP